MAAPPSIRMVGGMALTTSPTQRPRPRRRGGRDSADGQVLGALLVLGGIGWFLQQVGLVQLSVRTVLSSLLIALGVGLVLTARRAGGAGLVIVGLVLVVVLASASAVDVGLLQRGVGERTFTPVDAGDVADRYQLGIGSLTLDLSQVDAASLGDRDIDVQVGVGELVVLLPPKSELAVDVLARARAGELDVLSLDGQDDGTDLSERFGDPEAEGVPRVDLDLDVGVGTVQVVRPAG